MIVRITEPQMAVVFYPPTPWILQNSDLLANGGVIWEGEDELVGEAFPFCGELLVGDLSVDFVEAGGVVAVDGVP
jgi:hypothetical protein